MAYLEGPETDRLILRAPTPDDAEAMFLVNGDPEVMRYTGEPMPPSAAVIRDFLAAYPDFDRHGFGRWTAVEKATGEIIGFAGLKYLEDLEVVDIGYRLRRSHWGRGLATEAALACVEFGFDTIGLDYVIGLVMPANTPSVRVLEKLGMTYETAFVEDGYDVHRYGRRRA